MIDLTKGIRLSSAQVEETVASVTPVFISEIDSKVEFATRFPNMMVTLWSLIVLIQKYPSQNQFLDYYLEVHKDEIRNFSPNAVRARVLRTYPSITREVHFYSLVNESGLFNQVDYSIHDDVTQGIDLKVYLGGKCYNVSCFVLTKRSLHFRETKKNTRHIDISNSIELPIDLSSGKHNNGWVFFDIYHVNQLFGEVLDLAWLKYNQHPLDLIC
ncbi:hypothetical protein [Paenibacillus taichungensis]|uniref:hypothetical protein n=1 Tax=Paenibacillus taichungensis TaxID=484184 RepID=UPI002870C3CF|nr:hypothetical protein [Paenibacillus taichungensis]MDR9749302.1 hypothetical protein [Paenibacillus taichungensis]